jgi:prepilin-type N-terminal cleavage/methylation domain-containing protein
MLLTSPRDPRCGKKPATKSFPAIAKPGMTLSRTNTETARELRAASPTPWRTKPAVRGVTLVEVMVATVLLAVLMVGMLLALVQSYRIAAEVRIRNEIRYVLRSMSDQFMVNSIPTSVEPADLVDTPPTPFFKYSTVPTGEGLSWRTDLNTFIVKPASSASSVYINGTADGLTVPLGRSSGTPVNVTFTRRLVRVAVLPGQAAPSQTANEASAGFMLQADFSARFSILGRQLSQSVTLVRSVQ